RRAAVRPDLTRTKQSENKQSDQHPVAQRPARIGADHFLRISRYPVILTATSAATDRKIAIASIVVNRTFCLCRIRSSCPSRLSVLSRSCSRIFALVDELWLTFCIASPTLDKFSAM